MLIARRWGGGSVVKVAAEVSDWVESKDIY